MDLSQLHVFLTVAREQSFSRAAEKLYRTQPAVSIVIRKLEESVGQPLLVRGARQVKLTDAGELLRDYAERPLNLRDEIQNGMIGQDLDRLKIAYSREMKRPGVLGICLKRMVGARGFEPPASWSRTRRASQAALRPDSRHPGAIKTARVEVSE